MVVKRATEQLYLNLISTPRTLLTFRTMNDVCRCVPSSEATHLTSEATAAVYIKISKLSPMIPLIRILFTPCIAKRRAGKKGTSTPVVMPILKIKPQQRQTLCSGSHVWRPAGDEQGKVMGYFQV